MSKVLTKYIGVLLLPCALSLTGCGVSPKMADPAATAGVERCGSATRACWQVKPTVQATEYPADVTAAAPAVRPESAEQAGAN